MNKQPKKDVIVVFSGRPNSHFFEVGGTAAWVLNPVRARECVYALITRNAHDKRWIPGPEKHRSPFLIGRIKAIMPWGSTGDRFLIEFSEFARLDESLPEKAWWKDGHRNPVRYDTLENLGIDPAKLHFEPMPKRVQDGAASESLPDMKPAPNPSLPTAGALTIAEAKRGLALGLGVSPEAVEITIRG